MKTYSMRNDGKPSWMRARMDPEGLMPGVNKPDEEDSSYEPRETYRKEPNLGVTKKADLGLNLEQFLIKELEIRNKKALLKFRLDSDKGRRAIELIDSYLMATNQIAE